MFRTFAAEVIMLNECRFEGRLSASAEEHIFPSGDVAVMFRLIVPRPIAGQIDTINCRVDSARLRRRALALSPGSELTVAGSLHRRFWRSPTGPASRYEVVVTELRRCR